MLILQNVLQSEELAEIRGLLTTAGFVPGARTAGHQAQKVKRNLQLPLDSTEHARLDRIVARALDRHTGYFSAALPNKRMPILFNRYEAAMDYGIHVDNAYMREREDACGVRTDIAATLFLSDPSDYDGGELVVHSEQMVQRIKLPAGDMVLYPAHSRHGVEPVTRGTRDAAVFWVQSMVRDAGRRNLLFEFDRAIQGLSAREPEAPEILLLTTVYNGMLREWIEV